LRMDFQWIPQGVPMDPLSIPRGFLMYPPKDFLWIPQRISYGPHLRSSYGSLKDPPRRSYGSLKHPQRISYGSHKDFLWAPKEFLWISQGSPKEFLWIP
jgi:hypothetical protein